MIQRFLTSSSIILGIFLSVIMILFVRLSSGFVGLGDAQKGVESITAREIRAHINFLASDFLEGRGNGDRGLEIAAEYIAAQFEDAGLEPAGDNETYFQEIELVHKKLSEPNRFELTTIEEGLTTSTVYQIGEDFTPFSFTVSKNVVAPLVFVGYGITAPEYAYDDYEGVDVEGKVVLMLRHEPQERDSSSVFSGRSATVHAVFTQKAQNAQKHGAVGMILVTDPLNHDVYDILPLDRMWPENPPARRKTLSLAESEDKRDILAVQVTMDVAIDLIHGTGMDLKKIQESIDQTLKPSPFAIDNKTVLLQTSVRVETVTVRNVIGEMKGSSPEAIVVGAHYDHDGKDGEDIYNGADDDASGVTGLIEIAEAFALNDEKPKRSVLFIAFAAEEKGLLGAEHYVNHPVFPLDKTVAMIEMDMIGRNEDTFSIPEQKRGGFPVVKAEESENTLYVIGTTFSADMKKITEDVNREIGFDIGYDYDNVQSLVRRSDPWVFLKKGIPAVYYTTGGHPEYHTPDDTVEKINIPKMERVVRLVYLTTWNLANDREKPTYEDPRTVAD